jgi:uncharacterized protein
LSFSVDVNLLVYASNASCAEHARASRFLAQCAAGPDLFCLTWATVTGYLRITTHPAVFRRPLTAAQALANVDALLRQPHVRLLLEDDRFWAGYRELVGEQGSRGTAVPDAHLAALLRHHGVATLYTRDRDFRRFDFLTVIDPIENTVGERRANYRAGGRNQDRQRRRG